jgi:RimJ/RimL family protein N-acetyltransferase
LSEQLPTQKLNLRVLPASPDQLPLIHLLSINEPYFWHVPREAVSWDFFRNYGIQWYVAYEEESQQPVAAISFGSLDVHNRHACIGLIVMESERRRGVADACDGLIKQLAFEKFNLRKIWASVLTDNTVVITGTKKRGWRYQGLMKDAQFLDGKWRDRAYFEFYNPNEVK